MRIHRLGFLLAIPLAAALVPRAEARVAGGNGGPSDCYVEFDGVTATGTVKGKALVECTDGAACDADGQKNNSCTFAITPCAFQSDVAGCTPQAVVKYPQNNKHLALPPTGATAATCASATSVVVPLKKKRKSFVARQVPVKLKAKAASSPKVDANVFFLKCNPCSDPSQCGGGGGANPACPSDPANCKNNANNGPREIKLTSGSSGTDLDNGVTGTSHNFPVVSDSILRLCLTAPADKTTGCNGTDDPNCVACGATGAGSMNGPTFGSPLPLFAASVPVCVVNRFADATVQGTVNVQTGIFDAKVGSTATPVHLKSDVFLTNPLQVCPRCVGGKCNSGAKQGQSCTINGAVTVNNPPQAVNDHYDLSSDCPPLQSDFQATLDINLPLTTNTSSISGSKPCPGQPRDDDCGSIGSVCNTPCGGVTAAKGGINQICCGDGKTPCFPTSAASGIGKIERTGQADPPAPVWPDPTYPKVSSNGKLAAVFCEAKTNSPSIDTTTGLPGPGALILTGKQCLIGNNGTDCP